jgi:predicted dinucleotide-binding enzyme
MTVGVIGAGNIGRAVATHALRAGHPVVLSNSRGQDSQADVVMELGDRARAGSVAEASNKEPVVLAVPWSKIGDDIDAKGVVAASSVDPPLAADRVQLFDGVGRQLD